MAAAPADSGLGVGGPSDLPDTLATPIAPSQPPVSGVSRRASDIHFEPTSRKLQVKFRLDGQLKVVDELP